MLPHAKRFMSKGWIFQQDNDPKHASVHVREWFQRKKVEVMQWPAQSPDLNPIENLWDAVERRIRDRSYSNQHELFAAIQSAWSDIPKSIIDRLIDSMKRRCEEVIKNFGYATRY